MVKFKDEEKKQFFDEICACFFEKNFGRLTKTDMDLMMFRMYLQKAVDASKDENGRIDYRKCSDTRIARELGITPARVRSLKTRVQFASPIACDWKNQFQELMPHAVFDFDNRMVSVHVPDTGLFLEIQAYLEEKGCYVEKQLNSSLLRVPVEFYLELLTEVKGGIPRKELIKQIREKFADSRKEAAKYNPEKIGIGKALGYVADIAGIISCLNVPGIF